MNSQEESEIGLHPLCRQWLGSDIEYCRIKDLLIVFFASRQCGAWSDELADQVFNLVEKRLVSDPGFADMFNGPPARWFWGVARKVLAKARTPRKIHVLPKTEDRASEHRRLECLDQCLGQIAERQRKLILDYYSYDQGKKIPHREKLAKRMGITLNALRVRTCKIRKPIQKCVQTCLERGGDNVNGRV